VQCNTCSAIGFVFAVTENQAC